MIMMKSLDLLSDFIKIIIQRAVNKIIKKLLYPKIIEIIIHRHCWERENSLQKRFGCIQLSSPTWWYFGFIPINTLDNLSILSDYISTKDGHSITHYPVVLWITDQLSLIILGSLYL